MKFLKIKKNIEKIKQELSILFPLILYKVIPRRIEYKISLTICILQVIIYEKMNVQNQWKQTA